jgi:hypothetical protein
MRSLTSSGPSKGPTLVAVLLAPLLVASLPAASLFLAANPAHAAQDDESGTVGAITLLNRKAMEAYQELNFDEAQRLLRQALHLSEARGLSQHSIRARTCVNLGMVLVGGFKDREQAIKLFHQALQISPEIRLSRAMANPQIQEVFDEAVRRLASEPAAPTTTPPLDAAVALPAEKLLVHNPVRTGLRGNALAITASLDASLGKQALILGYRPAGAAVFTEVSMQRQPNDVHLGLIPEAATAGGHVEYYIEARGANGKRTTSRGSSVDPLIVTLSAPEVTRSADVAAPAMDPAAANDDKRWVLTLMVGTGVGWTSGVGEVRQLDITPSGFAWAGLGHLAPAVGYMVTPHLLLGVQGRLQLVTGATEFRPSGSATPGVCGGDGVCSPAKGAFAALARAQWLLNAPSSAFRPFLSASVGGGLIRHVAQAGDQADCGPARNAKCFDTVAAGPFLFGTGVGFSYDLSQGLSLVVALDGLVGVPKLTAEIDANVGVSLRL